MRVALKIDVHTVRGAMVGVPALLHLLEAYEVRASFAIATGRPLQPGLAGWLPGASLERRAADHLRAIKAAGHEIGLAFDDVRDWRRRAALANEEWTQSNLARGIERFGEVLGIAPEFCAAPDWQVNPHLLALQSKYNWPWASDTRGRYPFRPVLQGVRSSCIQIPTTLPTLDEVLRDGRASADDAHEYLYAESRHLLPTGHVYNARADLEGIEFLAILEKLIVMWKGQEGALRCVGDIVKELPVEGLPLHQIGWTQVSGRDTHVAMQSVQVPE